MPSSTPERRNRRHLPRRPPPAPEIIRSANCRRARTNCTVTVPGFKKYVRQNLTLLVQQTLRIDVALEVGSAAESITVSEATSLLKTESGELSHNVTANRMDDLPILSIGANIRQPLAVTQLLPGTAYIPNPSLPSLITVSVNGTPTNSERLRMEGQDATNGLGQGAASQTQGSVDAIQEVRHSDQQLRRRVRPGGRRGLQLSR